MPGPGVVYLGGDEHGAKAVTHRRHTGIPVPAEGQLGAAGCVRPSIASAARARSTGARGDRPRRGDQAGRAANERVGAGATEVHRQPGHVRAHDGSDDRRAPGRRAEVGGEAALGPHANAPGTTMSVHACCSAVFTNATGPGLRHVSPG